MTVKELKNALLGISEPIDRIAGFCDNYDQMFDHCEVRVNENTVEIDTEKDLCKPMNFRPVTESIAQILALPDEMDNHIIFYMGEDNYDEIFVLTRDIRRVTVVNGTTGCGISLQGPQPSGILNQHCYLTKLFVNDERAKSLNQEFYDFLDELDITCDFMDSRETDEGIFVQFLADGVSSATVIALMAGTFKDVVFCRVPYDSSDEVSIDSQTTMKATAGASMQPSTCLPMTVKVLSTMSDISIAFRTWSMPRGSVIPSRRRCSSSPSTTLTRNWATLQCALSAATSRILLTSS